MGFWKFCEKVEGFVGITKTIRHINDIYLMYMRNLTVAQVVDAIKSVYPKQ